PQPVRLPFTGRTAELEKLATLASSHRLGLIEGDTGIGKTRLAEEFLRDFQGLVLVGHAHELEQALPYPPVIEALRELIRQPGWPQLQAEAALPQVWRAELGRLLPELHDGGVPAPADGRLAANNESRLWEAVSQLLLGLARGHALALLIDDLHWADASTLALLGYLVRQPTHAAITFLATTRPITPRTQLATLVQTLTREGRILRLPLGRLGDGATFELAQHFSPRYAYPLAEWLTRNADGSPYILAELLRYASEHQLLLPDGTLNLSLLSSSPVVPGTVYSLLQARLAGLSDAARRVVDVGVVVGSEFDLELVAQAAALPEPAVLDALDELLAEGLEAAVQRSSLLHVVLPDDGRSVNWYVINTSANRLWAERIGLAGAALAPNAAAPDDRPALITLYEHNIGLVTPLLLDELREAEDRYPMHWIEDAIREAVRANARSWRYISKVLERWAAHGRQDAPNRAERPIDVDKYTNGSYGDLFRRGSDTSDL
ncbi:hypothetical protein SE17_25520, partial [Kouleothrix aurantiaca]